MVAIEHNLDIICKADTIIDFGPGGGLAGGKIVATGTPQEIAANKNSLTGQCLKAYIAGQSVLTTVIWQAFSAIDNLVNTANKQSLLFVQ